MNNSTDYWMPTYAALLCLGSVLTASQQQKFQNTCRSLADVLEGRGDIVASYFLHSLAQDEFIEQPTRPQLRLVK